MRRKVLMSADDGPCYSIGEPISHGIYSSVYRCHYTNDRFRQFAAKIYNRSRMEAIPESKQVLANEITALYSIQSSYICNKVDIFDSDRNIYIVVEYAPNGNLLQAIKKHTTSVTGAGGLSDRAARRWLQQLLWGLSDIHQSGFAHLDVKPENLVLDKSNDLKICDFGFCVPFERGQRLFLDCGTPVYVAPEVLECAIGSNNYDIKNGSGKQNNKSKISSRQHTSTFEERTDNMTSSKLNNNGQQQQNSNSGGGGGYDGFQADVWSVGVTLYVMLTGTLPFFGRSNEELLQRTKSGRFPETSKISELAMHFLKCCLDPDPTKRWTIEMLNHHPYCRGLEANQVNFSILNSNSNTLMSDHSSQYPYPFNNLLPMTPSTMTPSTAMTNGGMFPSLYNVMQPQDLHGYYGTAANTVSPSSIINTQTQISPSTTNPSGQQYNVNHATVVVSHSSFPSNSRFADETEHDEGLHFLHAVAADTVGGGGGAELEQHNNNNNNHGVNNGAANPQNVLFRADAHFAMASHSWTSLREFGARVLNEKELKSWKVFARRRKRILKKIAERRKAAAASGEDSLTESILSSDYEEDEEDLSNTRNNNNNNNIIQHQNQSSAAAAAGPMTNNDASGDVLSRSQSKTQVGGDDDVGNSEALLLHTFEVKEEESDVNNDLDRTRNNDNNNTNENLLQVPAAKFSISAEVSSIQDLSSLDGEQENDDGTILKSPNPDEENIHNNSTNNKASGGVMKGLRRMTSKQELDTMAYDHGAETPAASVRNNNNSYGNLQQLPPKRTTSLLGSQQRHSFSGNSPFGKHGNSSLTNALSNSSSRASPASCNGAPGSASKKLSLSTVKDVSPQSNTSAGSCKALNVSSGGSSSHPPTTNNNSGGCITSNRLSQSPNNASGHQQQLSVSGNGMKKSGSYQNVGFSAAPTTSSNNVLSPSISFNGKAGISNSSHTGIGYPHTKKRTHSSSGKNTILVDPHLASSMGLARSSQNYTPSTASVGGRSAGSGRSAAGAANNSNNNTNDQQLQQVDQPTMTMAQNPGPKPKHHYTESLGIAQPLLGASGSLNVGESPGGGSLRVSPAAAMMLKNQYHNTDQIILEEAKFQTPEALAERKHMKQISSIGDLSIGSDGSGRSMKIWGPGAAIDDPRQQALLDRALRESEAAEKLIMSSSRPLIPTPTRDGSPAASLLTTGSSGMNSSSRQNSGVGGNGGGTPHNQLHPPPPRKNHTPTHAAIQRELNRALNVHTQRPSIYLRLEWVHFQVLVRWCFVVLQFLVLGLFRILFNIRLEKYFGVGPLARLLNFGDDEEEGEQQQQQQQQISRRKNNSNNNNMYHQQHRESKNLQHLKNDEDKIKTT